MNNFWKSMASIALGVGASYASSKISNEQTSWVPYRADLLKNIEAVTMATVADQVQKAMASFQQPQAPQQPQPGMTDPTVPPSATELK